jgi:hypothetical protein
MHVTVQGVSRLPDLIQQESPRLLGLVKGGLADVDAFDATLAEPVVGYGGVFCDVLPKQRFEVIRDAVRRGLARLGHCLTSTATAALGGGVRDRPGPDRLAAPIMVPLSDRPELARSYGRVRRIAPIATELLLGRARRSTDRPGWLLTDGCTASTGVHGRANSRQLDHKQYRRLRLAIFASPRPPQ